MSLAGRVIIITGASSGIGAATARACGTEGMRVVLHARRADRLRAVADAVRAAGGDAEIVVGDVTSRTHVAELLTAAEDAEMVFANAGYGLMGSVVHEAEEETRRLWEVNYFASMSLLREAARHWIERGRRGHLLVCSSCLSQFSLPLYGSYAATKAAQAALAASLRFEVARHGIAVSSVHPVTTATGFFGQMTGGEEGSTPAHTPKRFVQTPDRVADAVVRCLRRPVPEVWTSRTVRFSAALFTAFPRLGHRILERQTRAELRAYDASAGAHTGPGTDAGTDDQADPPEAL